MEAVGPLPLATLVSWTSDDPKGVEVQIVRVFLGQ